MSENWIKVCELEKGNFLVFNVFTDELKVQHSIFLSKRNLKEEEKGKALKKVALEIINKKGVLS